MTNKKYNPNRDAAGNLRALTPVETLVLTAFSDNGAQDHITIGVFLNGGHSFPKANYRACERLAKVVLGDLLAMGYLTSDSAGWLRLAPEQGRVSK